MQPSVAQGFATILATLTGNARLAAPQRTGWSKPCSGFEPRSVSIPRASNAFLDVRFVL